MEKLIKPARMGIY